MLKKKLPAITFSGIFVPTRIAKNLDQYNGLIILDIDKLNNEELIQKKKLLSNDLYVVAVWISPSGVGLEFLIYSPYGSDKHKEVYRSAAHFALIAT